MKQKKLSQKMLEKKLSALAKKCELLCMAVWAVHKHVEACSVEAPNSKKKAKAKRKKKAV
jgi:hypothetical protein